MTSDNRITLTDDDILFTFFTMNYSSDERALEKELSSKFGDNNFIKYAKKALMNNWDKFKTFALIKVETVYCWIKHDGETLQDNIYLNEVYPFSEHQTYLAQRIKKEFLFI